MKEMTVQNRIIFGCILFSLIFHFSICKGQKLFIQPLPSDSIKVYIYSKHEVVFDSVQSEFQIHPDDLVKVYVGSDIQGASVIPEHFLVNHAPFGVPAKMGAYYMFRISDFCNTLPELKESFYLRKVYLKLYTKNGEVRFVDFVLPDGFYCGEGRFGEKN